MDVNFAYLPPHVLANIFTYLNVSDLNHSVLVCTSWYSASCCIACSRNIQMTIKDDEIKNIQYIRRPFHTLKLTSVSFDQFDSHEFFLKFAFSLRSLNIDQCFMSFDQLFDSLNILRNLQSLRISLNIQTGCTDSLNTNFTLATFIEMKTIIIDCSVAQCDAINMILQKCINLDRLKYYTYPPVYTNRKNERDKLVAALAQWNCVDLIELDIFNCTTDTTSFLKQFCTLNIKRLDCLNLSHMRRDYNRAEFDKFCKHINVLKDLQMAYVHNVDVISICEHLKNLNRLLILYFDSDQLGLLGGLHNLEILILTSYKRDNENQIPQLVSAELPNLKVLRLTNINISKENLMLLCNKFKNLTDLKLKPLKTADFSDIFKNMIRLKILCLHVSESVPDISEAENKACSILNLQELEFFRINRVVPGITEALLKQLPNLKQSE